MRLLLVGSATLMWEGIAQLLSGQTAEWSITRLSTIEDALLLAPDWNPDVVMIQSRLYDGSAADAVCLLRRASFSGKVIVLGVDDRNDKAFLAALEEGAHGFIDNTSSFDDLLSCIRRVVEGDIYIPHRLAARLASEYKVRKAQARPDRTSLTERELEILNLLAVGYSNKAMAHQLVVSEHTVRAHLRNIMHKLGAENRVQAVALATREGLLSEARAASAVQRDKVLTA